MRRVWRRRQRPTSAPSLGRAYSYLAKRSRAHRQFRLRRRGRIWNCRQKLVAHEYSAARAGTTVKQTRHKDDV